MLENNDVEIKNGQPRYIGNIDTGRRQTKQKT